MRCRDFILAIFVILAIVAILIYSWNADIGDANRGMVLINTVLAIMNAIMAGAIVYSAWKTQESTKAVQESAKASQKSAKAVENSAEASQRTANEMSESNHLAVRPHLYLTHEENNDRVMFYIKNAGNGPAIIKDFYYCIHGFKYRTKEHENSLREAVENNGDMNTFIKHIYPYFIFKDEGVAQGQKHLILEVSKRQRTGGASVNFMDIEGCIRERLQLFVTSASLTKELKDHGNLLQFSSADEPLQTLEDLFEDGPN